MAESESLPGAAVGQEPGVERRRARTLGRILESAPKLHTDRDPVRMPDTLAEVAASLFPGCRTLIVLSGIDPTEPDRAFEVVQSSLTPQEVEAARALAIQVASAGVPAYGADGSADLEGLACCVPIRHQQHVFGAIYLTMPYGPFANIDELTGYLRHLAAQAALALAYAIELRTRAENLELIARETGGSLAEQDVPLSAAKRAFERWLIQVRLKQNRGNIAAAARALSMDRGQLSRLVKRHQIDKNRFKARLDGHPSRRA